MLLWTHNLQDTSILKVPTVSAQELTVDDLKGIATEIAEEHHLNVQHFLRTIEGESNWDINAEGDYPDGKGGFVQESKAPEGAIPTSIGLCQLHYPTRDWGISTSTAYQPRVCMEIMATAWEKGQAKKWSAYNALVASGWR